jgi:hypothetical protein
LWKGERYKRNKLSERERERDTMREEKERHGVETLRNMEGRRGEESGGEGTVHEECAG